ncbi:hypothetical protein ACFLRM_03705 [Acidobacteriota bacterium]
MGKKEIKKSIIKLILWFLGATGAYLISVIIKSVSSKINILESTKEVAKFLFQAEIGLLILILILFKLVHSINKKDKILSAPLKKELSEKNIIEILAANKRLIKLLNELRDKTNRIIAYNASLMSENKKLGNLKIALENLGSNNEALFILETLANIPNRTEKLSIIMALYTQKFGKKTSDLQILLDELDDLQFIEVTECGEFGEICYLILRKGLRFLKQAR